MADFIITYYEDVEVQHFLAFLREEQTIYSGESKTEAHLYTPRSVLLRYFTDGRGSLDDLLRAVLKEEEHIIPTAEVVSQHFLTVFAILLSVGQAQSLNRFVERDYNDERLPFFDRPRHFPEATTGSLFDAFFAAQFRFCPIRFTKNPVNLQIEPEQILPLRRKQQLRVIGHATTYKVELHEDYDPFVEDPSPLQIELGIKTPVPHVYIFKEFNGKAAKSAYDKELTAFLFLQKQGQLLGRTIVGFHGSFAHGDTSTIILEYADRGTFDDYVSSVPPPTTGEDITRLWESLLKLQEALHAVHNLSAPFPQDVKQYSLLRGWHGHIKPENIGVSSSHTNSDYDCQFRIIDLGTSHSATEIELHSTTAYAAPECSQGVKEQDINMQMADVWSLGCIFSEFAVWTSLGLAALKDYRADRADHGRNLGVQDVGAFHDGWNLLQCVRAWNYHAVDNKHPDDRVTEAVLQQIVEEMLYEDSDARPSTRQLKMKTNRILARAREQHLADIRRYDSSASNSTTYSSMRLSSKSQLSHHVSFRSTRSDSSDSGLGYGVGLAARLARLSTVTQDSGLSSPQPIEEERASSIQSSNPTSPVGLRSPSLYQSMPNDFVQEMEGTAALSVPSRPGSRVPFSDVRLSHGTSTMNTALVNGDDKEIVVTRSPFPTAMERPTTSTNQNVRTLQHLTRPHIAATSESSLQTVVGVQPDFGFAAQHGHSAVPLASRIVNTRPNNGASSQSQRPLYTTARTSPLTSVDSRRDYDLQRSYSQTPSTTSSNTVSTQIAPDLDPRYPASHFRSHIEPSISTSLSPTNSRSSIQTYKPCLNMIDGLLWLNSKKASASTATLRDESYLSTLSDRDFIFLVDDSRSMRAHREMTSRAVRLLSWLLKKQDKNGMDLYFTNKAGKTHARPGHSSDLQRPLLKQLDVADGTSDVSVRLMEILNEFRQRSAVGSGATKGGGKNVVGARKIIIYVLSDGLWAAGSEVKLKADMEWLAATLREQGAPENAIGIQFIRTVETADVVQRMNSLNGGQYSNRIGVDSAFLEGNVFRLLLGPATDIWNDEQDQNPDLAQARTEGFSTAG